MRHWRDIAADKMTLADRVCGFIETHCIVPEGQFVGKPMRLGGMVKTGSVKWDPKALDLRFTVTDGARDMVVHSTGAPPQMFRDSMGVIVEGRVGSGGVFEATNLMVKHSNEYRAPKPGEEAHEKYKTLIRQSSP